MKNMLNEPYNDWHAERYYEPDVPLNREDAQYLLITMNRVMKAHDIVMMPMFGTLLGAIREHGFIKNDGDIDVVIYSKDTQNVMNLRPELEKHDIHLHCYVLPWIFTFVYKGITLDFYPIYESAWPWTNRYYLLCEKYVNKKYFSAVEDYELFGEVFSVPANPERLLAYIYGNDWRIPKSSKGHLESRLFFWRYAHRYIQKWERRIKRMLKKIFSKN